MYGYLMHHGIKGQKWGVRRFQNADGSLTPDGRKRYGYSEKATKKYGKNETAYLRINNDKIYYKKNSFKNVMGYEPNKKYSQNPYDDISFEKKSKFYRLSTTSDESNLNRIYVTQTPERYNKLGTFVIEQNLLLKTYEVNKDIKLAGINTVNKILNEIGESYITPNYIRSKKKKLSSDIFNEENDISKYGLKRLKEMGYDGLIDPEDSGGTSSSAYILTNKKSVNKIKEQSRESVDWKSFENKTNKLKEKIKQKHDTVFISGSSKTQDKTSNYYRKQLPKDIRNEIDGYIKKGDKILVGDAPGIDRQVQNYLNKKGYSNVVVYGPGKNVRYSANKKWKTKTVNVADAEPMSPNWLVGKDIAMARSSNKGLAIVLDKGGAKATRNNVKRLISQQKDVKIFELSGENSKYDKYVDELIDELDSHK